MTLFTDLKSVEGFKHVKFQESTYDNLANISKYKGSQRCHTRMKAASFQQAVILMQIYLIFEVRLTKAQIQNAQRRIMVR